MILNQSSALLSANSAKGALALHGFNGGNYISPLKSWIKPAAVRGTL